MSELYVVTGASSGIGAATVTQLAALGHTVVAVARDAASPVPAGATSTVYGDLSLLSGVRSVAHQVLELGMPVRSLILNAAVAAPRAPHTPEGFDLNYATNVLGVLLLEQLLAPSFAPDARVIVLGSSEHRRVKSLDLEAVTTHCGYPESKLLAMLVARELSHRSAASVSIADPGFVRTNLGRHATGGFALLLRLTRGIQDSPEKAAATSVWLATAAGAASRNGGYFAGSKPATAAAIALDDALAKQVYDKAESVLTP